MYGGCGPVRELIVAFLCHVCFGSLATGGICYVSSKSPISICSASSSCLHSSTSCSQIWSVFVCFFLEPNQRTQKGGRQHFLQRVKQLLEKRGFLLLVCMPTFHFGKQVVQVLIFVSKIQNPSLTGGVSGPKQICMCM